MFGSILSRLILAELVKVFLLSLTALTGMFLLAGLVQEATQRGLSPGQIALLIPLLIPSTLPYTIPATTLFATCVVYGRMAHDNEITVIRSAGVHILHLLKPAILLGVTSTAVTFWLYTDTIPRTQRMMRDKLVQNAEDVLYGMLKRDGSIRQGSMPYVIFVKEVQGKRLVDVIFKKRSKPMPGAPMGLGYDAVVRAREAKLRVDPAGGRILVELEGVHVVGDKETSGMVKERTESVPIPDQIFGKDAKARPSSLTWDELHERRAEVMQEIADNVERIRGIEDDLKTIAPGEVYERFKQELLMHTYELKERRRLLRSIDAEFQIRPSLALGCLCFVLIGCPVGIWASRADYLSTFVVCFLPTVFVYYPLVMGGTKFAKDGRFHEVPAIWAADGVLMAIALFLVWRLTRR